MNIELDRKGLESLIKGTGPHFDAFKNNLVVKAGFEYSDQYGRIDWRNLSSLTDNELYELYIICRKSWEL